MRGMAALSPKRILSANPSDHTLGMGVANSREDPTATGCQNPAGTSGSKAKEQFEITEMGTRTCRVNGLRHGTAARRSVIDAQRDVEVDVVIPAHVVEGRQTRLTVGGPTRIPKRRRLKRPTAGVPQVLSIGQPKGVHVGTQRE